MKCPKCKGEESPHSVENVSVGSGNDLWKCHECGTVFNPPLAVVRRGRPSIGERRSVALTMESEDWEDVETILEERQMKMGEYLRKLVLADIGNHQIDIYEAIKKAQEIDRP